MTLRFPSYWSRLDAVYVLRRLGLTDYEFDLRQPGLVFVTLPAGAPIPSIPAPVELVTETDLSAANRL